MKRVFFSMMVLGGFIFVGTFAADAAETEPEKQQIAQTVRPGYTDANDDGVCDYFDGKRPGRGSGPGNGQGIGSANGQGLGKGLGLRYGTGNGQRRPNGSGAGRNQGTGRQLRDGTGDNCPLQGK